MSPASGPTSFCSRTAAAEATKQLLSRYRRNEADDAVGFLTGIATVFRAYPEFIAWLAGDPIRGLPAQTKFVPTIAEVKAFCDQAMGPVYEERRQRGIVAEQMRRRALPPPSDDAARERAIENVVGRFGPGWGLDADRVREAAIDPKQACMTALRITEEQFAAIPSAKGDKATSSAVAPAGSFKPVGSALPDLSFSPSLQAKMEEGR